MNKKFMRSLQDCQDLIFESTVSSKNNWIRFPIGSVFHNMIINGEIEGITIEDVVEIGDDMLELNTNYDS